MRCLSAIVLAAAAGAQSPELESPVRLESAGRPIDVQIGHAAPLWTDWDGDGRNDLLVGQFGDGRLRIYRNAGTQAAPRFDGFTWFEVDGRPATVPTG
jgi:hypothetical protein